MTDILSLDSIGFVRDSRTILNCVSWTVRRGEHWAILGANGSGKTTLLKIVTGYEWASEGTLDVLGNRFGETDVRALRRHVGWVSASIEQRLPADDDALDVVLSGIDASLGLYRHFDRDERNAALAALAGVGGDHLAHRKFGVLSQGEQQRVLIARALAARPALLLLDEPCAGLDPAARHHFLRDIGNLAQTPTAPALVLVTHHIEEIGPWINRVLILARGAVLAQGTPEETLTAPILSEAFAAPCEVTFEHGSYRLDVKP
ncbi:MAG: ATP-binding cassette domain-containing protein [Candidatus Hydrogenedentes bacterium]|nr:ATP-binding cassette domain-containing protein [Candidatus Hydrogenedentota bacterium]